MLARTAVLVSGGGTNLQALIDAKNNGIIKNAEISLVVSDKPDAYALTRAKSAGIATVTLDKENFESELVSTLDEHKIDIIVLAGFLRILSADFTSRYPERILNVHPSLIPSFCGKGFYGLRVHRSVLERGVKVTGATVHFVNEIPDGGRIIMQKAVSVLENDTPETLQKRVMRLAEWQILPKALEKVAVKITGGKNE